jgi:choline dehydrogenase
MNQIQSLDFAERVIRNQRLLTSRLRSEYDFIVCGSGSSGSVVARRLAENADVSVLLLEAGGGGEAASVGKPERWFENLGSVRDWGFRAEPNPHLNGRAIPLNMGKVLGGGSSINVMVWARGHKNDWDFFAEEAGSRDWSYAAVLDIYKRVENWQGKPEPSHRGTGGPVFVQPAPDPNPIAAAALEGASSVGVPIFDNPNGEMMEGTGGCAIADILVRDGKRQSIFRSYTFPCMDRPNLTVLTGALVTQIVFDGSRATGVELFHDGRTRRIQAGIETILSLGAINTPKLLMQSGVGNSAALRRLGIPIVQHLPGVGENFQDHFALGCIWEYEFPLSFRNNGGEAIFFSKSCAEVETPDIQICQGELPIPSIETAARYNPPAASWTMLGGVVRPMSRGRVSLTGADPTDPIRIEANTLANPGDMKAAVACVKLCRAIANSAALRPFVRREVMPGQLQGTALENFIRDAAVTYWHQSGTAKMGCDMMSVVDGNLKVYGIEGLRIADASIMPRVTTGNTMAPCVVIGERAADIIRHKYTL